MMFSAIRRVGVVMAATCAASMLIPRPAFADDAEERKSEAKKLFEQGSAALAKKDFVTGCALMRESAGLFVVANSLFQVAMCDERELKFASALMHWKRGWALVDKGDPRARVASRSIEALEKRVPRIKIAVPAKVAPVVVLIDDNEVSPDELEGPVPVDPGRHVVTIRKEGRQDKLFYVLVDEAQRTELEIDIGPPVVSIVPKNGAVRTPREVAATFRTAAFVTLGVGALGFVGAAVTGGMIVSNDTTIDEKCAQKLCDVDTYDVVQEQRTLLPVNAAMWAVGAVGVSTAAVLFVVASRSGRTKTPEAAMFPLPLAGGGGIGLAGRF